MKNVLLFITLMFLLTGCAVTRDHISLNYHPMINVQKIPEAEGIPVEVAVSDKRVKKDRVGRKINGLGIPMASIVCKNQVDEVVKKALVQELANRGFITNYQNPKILVDIELIKLSNRFIPGFWVHKGISETNLGLKIQSPDGNIKYSKNVLGKGVNKNILIATGSNAKIALERSLKDAIVQVVEDPEFIKALLENSQTSTPIDTVLMESQETILSK